MIVLDPLNFSEMSPKGRGQETLVGIWSFLFFFPFFFVFNSFPLESHYLASNCFNKTLGFNAFGHALDRGTLPVSQ